MSKLLDEAIRKRSEQLLARLRKVAPTLGLEQLSTDDRLALRRAARIRVHFSAAIDSPSFLYPERDRSGCFPVLFRRGISLINKRFSEIWYEALLVGRSDSRSAALDDDAAASVAMLGILTARDYCTRGDWVESVRVHLGRLYADSGTAHLFELHEQVSTVLRLAGAARHGVVGRSGSRISVAADALRRAAMDQRARGDFAAAERLFRQALHAATVEGDWNTAPRALIGLGRTRAEQGHAHSARYYFKRALASAHEHGSAEAEAMALHELFRDAVEGNSHRRADRLARLTFEAYRSLNHPDVYRLAHDVARYWLLLGECRIAAPVLRAALLHFPEHEHLYVWGNIARAAGALNDAATCEEALRRIEAADPDAEFLSRGLTGLAYGLRALGRAREATAYASRALVLALARGEGAVAREAAEFVREARGAAPRTAPHRSALATQIVESLRLLRTAA